MARRKSVNVTGINHLSDVRRDDLWIFYSCVNCGKSNLINIGKHMLKPDDAHESAHWCCEYCGFDHNKDANLPEHYDVNWEKTLLQNTSIACQRFWKNFFIISTGNPEYYWKRCQACGRVLPASSFSHHKNGENWKNKQNVEHASLPLMRLEIRNERPSSMLKLQRAAE